MRKATPAFKEFLLYFLGTFCILSTTLNVAMFLKVRKLGLAHDRRIYKDPPKVGSEDHIRGSSDAAVTIIEYSDYQCPYCKELNSELKTLISQGANIRWILRNRPLPSIHPLAIEAATSAECAGRQGKFWQYSDALFESKEKLESSSVFEHIAQDLTLNTDDFNACRKSELVQTVKNQAVEADSLGIETTPTIFINGERFDGLLPFSSLESLVRK